MAINKEFIKKTILSFLIVIIFLCLFYTTFIVKDDITKNPLNYNPYRQNISSFMFEGKIKAEKGIIGINDTINAKDLAYREKILLYDYANKRYSDKMELIFFFALILSFYSFMMSIYLFIAKRKNEIDKVMDFNIIILAALFILFFLCFDKFYYDIFNLHLNIIMEIMNNTIGVIL